MSKLKHHYPFVLSIPEPINNQIIEFKKEAFSRIGYFDSYHSKPHISLMSYANTPENFKRTLGQKMKALEQVEPFTIRLAGFDFFDHSHCKTIFARVINRNAFSALFQALTHSKGKVPHITIAKTLPYHKFDKVWPQFFDKYYEVEFQCNSVQVFRIPGVQQKWEYVDELQLRGNISNQLDLNM